MLCAALRPLVFVYTEVRTCGPPGNGSHPDPGDHDIGHRCNDPQHDLGIMSLVIWVTPPISSFGG